MTPFEEPGLTLDQKLHLHVGRTYLYREFLAGNIVREDVPIIRTWPERDPNRPSLLAVLKLIETLEQRRTESQ